LLYLSAYPIVIFFEVPTFFYDSSGRPSTLYVTKKVLIVDDSKVVRDAVRILFEEEHGLAICGEAEDGVDAIVKAGELKPDLILLDLVMPKLNGAVAASVLKRILPEVPIILFTLYEGSLDALPPMVGVDVIVSKADGFKDLVRRVRELLYPQTRHVT
jgi:DNA-binding NarL/FixJ family response regulator